MFLITNWLAKKDGNGGLAFPSEFANGNVRIYGNVYGHPEFDDGEFVRTAIVVSYSQNRIKTASGNEYVLVKELSHYLSYLKAIEHGETIVKNWSVKKGKIVGITLDSTPIQGRIVAQSFTPNVCELEDGRKLFVDWLSRDPKYNPKLEYGEFLTFCLERCMPDVFCKHYKLFK